MTVPTHQQLAERLRDAYAAGAVPPMRDGLEPTDAAAAYAVQTINTRFWEVQGRRIVGRKAGLTAKTVQAQLGVDQPDFGVLFDDMRIADGGALSPAKCLQPKAEGEIAFVLAADLPSPDTTPEQVAEAVATVHAAIEIVDSRIADWKITFADTVADNGSSAFFVLADEGLPLAGLDLAGAPMVMRFNGKEVSTGVGAAALGHPLNAAAWLAQTLAARGEPLRAGDILLAGALGPMAALTPGDKVEVDVKGGRVIDAGNGHAYTQHDTPWGRPVARWSTKWGEGAKAEIAEIKQELVDRLGPERAEQIAYYSRNSGMFPNLVINDIMAITIRTFYPVAPDLMEVSSWTLGVKGESATQRKLRLDNFLEFLGPGGFATPDDVEALEIAQRGYAASREAGWNDISRGMLRKDFYRITDEEQMRCFWREWARRMER